MTDLLVSKSRERTHVKASRLDLFKTGGKAEVASEISTMALERLLLQFYDAASMAEKNRWRG